jgi:hypothetical protein
MIDGARKAAGIASDLVKQQEVASGCLETFVMMTEAQKVTAYQA